MSGNKEMVALRMAEIVICEIEGRAWKTVDRD